MVNNPKTFHVAPNPKSGWDVKRSGARLASSHHDNKDGCIKQSGRQCGDRRRRKG